MLQKTPKYHVIDHHSMWGWEKQAIKPEDAQIIFTFNDFLFAEDVKKWHSQNKKVIVFEHGWNSFFDYKLNNKPFLADGYMALGENAAKSLQSHGLEKKRVLVSGNPNFNNLETTYEYHNIPSILYTALHWVEDRRDYNNQKLSKIIDILYPYSDISIKTMINSKIDISDKISTTWYSDIYENKNLFKDIAQGLSKYDIILTPKESTFDFIALLLGKRVFRVGKEEEYRKVKEPHSRNILPYTEITTEILFKNTDILVDLKDEIAEKINISEILKWAESL